MKSFSEQILKGLTRVPTYGSPGTMVLLNDKAQAVFTGNSSGEVFLAASEYGNGRVFICAHDKYYYWLDDNFSESDIDDEIDEENDKTMISNVELNDVRKKFMDNVKKWLIKSNDLSSLCMLDVEDIIVSDYGIDKDEFHMVKWCQDSCVNEKQQNILLEYVSSGGSLLCAVTPWGYLYQYPDNKLSDLSIYGFLRKNFDVILTDSIISVNSTIPVEKNLAHYAGFSEALDKITTNLNNLENYCSTIECGLTAVKQEGLIHDDFISLLGNAIKTEFCKRSDELYPWKNKFIKKEDDKNILRLFCKCLIEKETEKAPNIEDFPGDFKVPPNLLTNVNIEIETIFGEWVSTSYYLPAGIAMIVQIPTTIDVNGWFLRVGAHADNISSCDEGLNRWPIITVLKPLKHEMIICSPFGGLVYFQR